MIPPSVTVDNTLQEQIQQLDPATRLESVRQFLQSYNQPSMVRALPLLFRLKGQPFRLDDYFVFEPLYRRRYARRTIVTSGRQIAKSTTVAARTTCQHMSRPHFATLVTTPLYEQVRRLSSNYFGKLVEESSLQRLLTSGVGKQSVLQRTFYNYATTYFSFAFLSADRTRGLSVNQNIFDEFQGFDPEFIPIIEETSAASPDGGGYLYTGTPLTIDNIQWRTHSQSSMAEWVVPCLACNHKNIPSRDHDLDRMIGPWRSDISEAKPGTICAKCRKPVSPRDGWWEHRWGSKRWEFAGYHIPQILLPLHYASPDNWARLLVKRDTRSPQVFYNEVCGEGYDSGSKLVSMGDLQKAAVLPPNSLDRLNDPSLWDYAFRLLAIDWGGGGEKEVSFTVYAVLGVMPDGRIDVIYAYKSLTPTDHLRETEIARDIASRFQCSFIAHDYSGAGAIRETLLFQAGFPPDRVYAVSYLSIAAGATVQYKPPTDSLRRGYYLVNKSHSLQLTCQGIKHGLIRFFEYDYKDERVCGLLHDFLALQEEKRESRGTDIYLVVRDSAKSDDFAQAVNIGAAMIWHKVGWPNFAEAAKFKMSEDALLSISPTHPQWDD